MEFGLCNAPAGFQRFVDNLLTGLQGSEIFAFLDDIVVFGENLRSYDNKMRKVFNRLKTARVCLQPGKCEFLRTEVTFLGHKISRDGVSPDPGKIIATKNFLTKEHDSSTSLLRALRILLSIYFRFLSSSKAFS